MLLLLALEQTSIELNASAPQSFVWIWGAATVLLATALGFVAGKSYANRSADRQLERAAQNLSTLYAAVLKSLDHSHELTRRLEAFPHATLTVEEVDRLEGRRSSLLEFLGRIVSRHREIVARQKEALALKRAAAVIKLEWDRGTLDAGTGLPDHAAFGRNLSAMLDATARAEVSSGLLVAKIDRLDQLKSRFGIAGADAFVKSMAQVLGQAVREQDLVCRLGTDSFAALLPSVDGETGRKVSQAIRNSVRVHTFRVSAGGPEVLVTASFGFTLCSGEVSPKVALARAEEALQQSMERGRNQLHFCDGAEVVACAAG